MFSDPKDNTDGVLRVHTNCIDGLKIKIASARLIIAKSNRHSFAGTNSTGNGYDAMNKAIMPDSSAKKRSVKNACLKNDFTWELLFSQ